MSVDRHCFESFLRRHDCETVESFDSCQWPGARSEHTAAGNRKKERSGLETQTQLSIQLLRECEELRRNIMS